MGCGYESLSHRVRGFHVWEKVDKDRIRFHAAYLDRAVQCKPACGWVSLTVLYDARLERLLDLTTP